MNLGLGLALTDESSKVNDTLCYLLLGVDIVVVDTDEQTDVLGLAALELSVVDTPEDVLYAIPSEAHIGNAALAEGLAPGGSAIVDTVDGIAAPEVGDRVADKQYLGVGSVVELDHLVMAHAPFIASVATLCDGREHLVGCVLGEHLAQLLDIGVGIGAATQVVGVRTLYHILFAKGDVGLVHIEEVLDSLCLELIVGFVEGGVATVVLGGDIGAEHAVGRGVALAEQDGGIALGAQLHHTLLGTLDDFGLLEVEAVRHSVNDEGTGVDLAEHVEDGRLHAGRAGEAQIDDGIFHLALHDIGNRHTGTRGRGTLDDGRAVDDDGALGRLVDELEAGIGVDAYLEPLHAVVVGQIEGILHATALVLEGQVLPRHAGGVGLHLPTHVIGYPVGIAVGSLAVEVYARLVDTGHIEAVVVV